MSRQSPREQAMQQTVYPSDPYTFVKHRAYRHYLNCWLAVTLQTWNNAAVVDGFAGAGIYSDGEAGSSVVVARSLLDHASLGRFRGKLWLYSQEERDDRRVELDRQLASQQRVPKLEYSVSPAGAFGIAQRDLAARAHQGDSRQPVLWLLDPFGPADLPPGLVRACLESGQRDEVILTFFAREMHRRRNVPEWQAAMTRHFGNEDWRRALAHTDMTHGMESLAAAYRDIWRRQGILSSQFAIKLPSETVRYYLIFLTHSDKGLECWTKMCRRMDDYMGAGASPHSVDQTSLLPPPTDVCRSVILQFADQEVSWSDLRVRAMEAGQSDSLLRAALTELAHEGLAFRSLPLEARTPWPDGCRVRVYPTDAAGDADS